MAGFKLIKIFTDTNIVHAAQSHLLISAAVRKYVSEHKEIESVELQWFLPQMVVDERRHQMVSAAKNLSPKITELEKLLGHSLGISEEIMEERVDSKIRKTVDELGIKVCSLNISDVDWDDIIKRSVQRTPPFEVSTEKEKGFRDAIIASTFLQELDKSPKTPRACLLVFISGDKRIKEYIQEKTSDSENVRVLDTLDELKSFLNAIASEVTEEYLKQLLPKAEKVFYDFEKKTGLYEKESVSEKILEQYEADINKVLIGFPGCFRRQKSITLREQTFISKNGQTIVWNRSLSYGFEIARFDTSSLETKNNLLAIPEAVVMATGESHFDVEWQHQISTKGNLIKPKLNEIFFRENTLDTNF